MGGREAVGYCKREKYEWIGVYESGSVQQTNESGLSCRKWRSENGDGGVSE